MEPTRHQRRLAACLALAALPVVAVAAAPASLADDCDFDFTSLDCMMNDNSGFGNSNSGFGNSSGGVQPGNLVIPATGGPPEVAVAPAPAGAPVVTAGGGLVIPAGPPIG